MIYVDHARLPFGRMKMSHLMADTHEELVQMAVLLGLERYIQHVGAPDEHLDVCESKRGQALRNGAFPVESRFLVTVVRRKRDLT